jgi:hypothetical protein
MEVTIHFAGQFLGEVVFGSGRLATTAPAKINQRSPRAVLVLRGRWNTES